MQMKRNGPWVHTSTIIMQGIFKRTHRQILGQVMDLNCFTWIFNLVLAKQLHFGQSHPPIPPHLSLVAPFARSTMVVRGRGGGGVTTGQVHTLQLWDQGCQGTFMGVEEEIEDLGVLGHDGTFLYFA